MTRATLRAAGLTAATVLTVLATAVPAYPTAAETLEGTSGPDRLRGTPADDVILGRGGDDDIRGRRGSDRMYGGRGADRLGDAIWTAGEGSALSPVADVFHGGPGRDHITAGRNDIVHAGAGNDEVYGYYARRGTVLDCGLGNHDVLHLNGDIRGELVRGCEDIRIRSAG